MIKFVFKYHYLLRNSEKQTIVYTDHKSLMYFLSFSMHDEIYNH